MRVLFVLILTTILTACMGASINVPTVTVDVARLESLPPGAGYTILAQQADGLADAYRELGNRGMTVDIQSICRYDASAGTILTPSGPYDAADMELWAFQIIAEGPNAARAIERGWPIIRTEVMAGSNSPTRDYDEICSVTTIFEDDMAPEEVEPQLVRIFSAGRQIGMKLSCSNIAC